MFKMEFKHLILACSCFFPSLILFMPHSYQLLSANSLFFKDFVYLLLEGGEGRQNHQCERETLVCCFSYTSQLGTKPTTQSCAPSRNWTSGLFDLPHNPQPTEPPGQGNFLLIFWRFYLFLERGEGRQRERERNIDIREKHQLIASCYMLPFWGLNP